MKSLKRIVLFTLIFSALIFGAFKFYQRFVDNRIKKNEKCATDYSYQQTIQRLIAKDIQRYDIAFPDEDVALMKCFKEKIACIAETDICERNFTRARDLEVCAPDSTIKYDYATDIQGLIKINHPKFDPNDCFTSFKEANDFTENLQFILKLKKEQNKGLAHKNCSDSLNQCKANLERCRFNYKSICKL